MAWRRGYGRRRYYRSRFTRRRSRFGYRRNRRYRRRFSSSRGTRSRTVKLTHEFVWSAGASTTSGAMWSPFNFEAFEFPGFQDYLAVYSSFRMLKARLVIADPLRPSSDDGDRYPYSFLVVPSRNFALTTAPVTIGGVPPGEFVPAQQETALRQTRYQYQVYPSRVRNGVTVGFHPYTMVTTGGPANTDNDTAYQRIWEARNWMPFSWVSGQSTQRTTFFGPYVVIQAPHTSDPVQYPITFRGSITLYVQFRGQR